MKRLLIGIAGAVASVGFMAPAATAASTDATTIEGPYGPAIIQDYGSCQNIWANLTENTRYYVKPTNGDGTTDVRIKLSGTFDSIAGQSPGACDSGADNGNVVPNGIHGRAVVTFYITVSGGTFDPSQSCDETCATDYTFTGTQKFVNTFFGPDATYVFSPTKLAHEVVRSRNRALCADRWSLDFDPTTGAVSNATGDIATTCN